MIHYLSDVLDRDHRDQYACIKYILERCCPYKKENDRLNTYKVYQDMNFMQLKWILDRCNFLAAKWYGLVLFDYALLFVLEDTELKPSRFDLDWNCDYEVDIHGYFKKDKKGNLIKSSKKCYGETYTDWLAPADIDIMNKVIFRWKLYGRFCQSISDWWFNLKYKLKKKA